ncbi:sulfatase [Ferrimonas pelagia]|uniref:Sulfatase n=2 Tax=Ferrimonas pelagia TaxID=1177826 RepID=A0ABP9EC01_9GAMM
MPVGAEPVPTNVVLITADDLGYEVFSRFTDGLPDLTPNMDAYVKGGVAFTHAHSNTSICMPSRSIMATGLYGINSGMMGFVNLKDTRIPTLMGMLKAHGYQTGVLGKVSHSTPELGYQWHFERDYDDLGAGRDGQLYAKYTTEFIEQSQAAGQPFYLMVNSHDPHREFHDPADPMLEGQVTKPSKLFSPDEVVVPSYLPDIPQVRLELSHYYNSVRRLDDSFGLIIKAIEDAGVADDTLVMFLSDNGSAFPFAKANTYMFSSRTKFFAKWPNGGIQTDYVDEDNFISFVDIMPSILDATGIEIDAEFDGQSFIPLLRGEDQAGRDCVYTQIDYKMGGPATPMRAIQDKAFIYIFNPWSREGANYNNGNEGQIITAMQAPGDDLQLERVRMFRERATEEFYDLSQDPGSLNNLIDNPEYQAKISEYRQKLNDWMVAHKDPVLPMLAHRDDPQQALSLLKSDYPDKFSLMPEQQLQQVKARQAENRARRAKAQAQRQQN